MADRRISLVLVVFLSVALLSGCAAFRSGETKPSEPWPKSKGPGKQSISLLISGESYIGDMRQDIPQQMIEAWQTAAANAYKESGLFSEVTIGAADTDLRAEIHFLDQGEANTGMAFLSGLTLTLIPAAGKTEFTVKTTLRDKEGQELGAFEKKETLSFWIQLFLVFVMPFNSPGSVGYDVLYDLNRATLADANGAGLFQARPAPGPMSRARTAP